MILTEAWDNVANIHLVDGSYHLLFRAGVENNI